MSNLAERLRNGAKFHGGEGDIGLETIMTQSADEIERLSAESRVKDALINRIVSVVNTRDSGEGCGSFAAHEKVATIRKILDSASTRQEHGPECPCDNCEAMYPEHLKR